MISEAELARLSWPGAPKIITKTIPGPKGKKLLADAWKTESMTRGGGDFPLVFDEGLGVTVKDPDGNLYIDISAGVGVNSVGRRHPKVVKVIKQQAEGLMHASDISNTKRTELAKKVASVMPVNLRHKCISYFTQSGSGALETAIKFSRHITGRSQLIAFHGAYHGVWCGTTALTTGNRYRHGWGPLIPGVIHVPYAYCYRCCFGLEYPKCGVQCGKYVDYVLNTPYTGADDVAAVFVEPQQGEGGYLVPPPEFFEIIKAACEKNGCLYIDDEVQAGAGRSGKMWAIEYTKVKPDMLTWGKGMGGDMPMAGLTFREDFVDKFVVGSQPNTFAANAVAAMVSMTNIDIITNKEDNLIGRAARLGEETVARLWEGAHKSKIIGDVRGRGLWIGVELVKNKKTKEPLDGDAMNQVIGGLLGSGIILVPCGRYGNVLRFMPSLTITRAYLDKATDVLLKVCKQVEAKIK